MNTSTASPVKSPKLKIPRPKEGTKLKHFPTDYKVMLALVTVESKRARRIKVEHIAGYCGASSEDCAVALTSLAARGLFTVTKAHSPVEFEFTLPLEVSKQLRKEAANYRVAMEAKAQRKRRQAARDAKRHESIPIHLKPVPRAEREKFRADAEALAQHMNRLPIAPNLAFCMARIGKDEVWKLAEQAMAAHTTGSLSASFFALYEVRRDEIMLGANG